MADAAAGIRVGGLNMPAWFLVLDRLPLLVPPEALPLVLADPKEAEAEAEVEVTPPDDGLQDASACLIDAAAAVGLK